MKRKITAYRLFIASILILGASFWLVQLNNASFNRLSHECVQNYNQQSQDILKDLGYITEQEAAQDRDYCETGSHPEIKDGWERANNFAIFIAFVFILPIFLCTGLILVYRWIRKKVSHR